MPTTRLISILAEESRYFLHELHQRLSQKSRDDRPDAFAGLDPDISAARYHHHQEQQCEFLRSRLRKTPYWRRGHLLLGETALNLNDVATSYACAKAVAALGGAGAQEDSDRLLARCYLKRSAFQEAAPLFEKLLAASPQDFKLSEDFAACLMGMEKFDQARRVLELIPEDRISAPGKAALLYAQKQNVPQNGAGG